MQVKKAQNAKSAGFTLIELLIVIIIIGILAAIGFVAYTGSQNRAKKADAEATLSQARSKLGEFNAEEGRYPSSKSEFTTWLSSSEGGNNVDLSNKLGDSNYVYEGTPTGCDASNNCSGYKLTANAALFNGSENIEVTN